jgi:uncharacterized protein with PQ loop repeat
VITALGAFATLLTVCFLLPQLARLRRTRDALGVSATTAAVGLVTTLAWIAYGVGTAAWAVIVPSAIGALQYVVLLALIRRSGRSIVASLGRGLVWSLTLVLAGVGAAAAGRSPLSGLGVALAASAVVQYAPAVLEAHRSAATTGIARATWLLVGANGITWALYGALVRDAPVAAHGLVLVAAATAVVVSTLDGALSHQRPGRWSENHLNEGPRTSTRAF